MIRPASQGERTVDIFVLKDSIEHYVRQLAEMKRFNQEYVIDYGPTPPDAPWTKLMDAIAQMFNDIQGGQLNV
jgi:hypothetical protein